METFAFASAVRRYHVYGMYGRHRSEKHLLLNEFNNPMDKRAVKAVKGNEMVGHLFLPNSVVFSCT